MLVDVVSSGIKESVINIMGHKISVPFFLDTNKKYYCIIHNNKICIYEFKPGFEKNIEENKTIEQNQKESLKNNIKDHITKNHINNLSFDEFIENFFYDEDIKNENIIQNFFHLIFDNEETIDGYKIKKAKSIKKNIGFLVLVNLEKYDININVGIYVGENIKVLFYKDVKNLEKNENIIKENVKFEDFENKIREALTEQYRGITIEFCKKKEEFEKKIKYLFCKIDLKA